MINHLYGYKIQERIYEGTNVLVYRGQRSEDDLPVIIKTQKRGQKKFNREYAILNKLNCDGVVKAIALEHPENIPTLIVEDFGGISLKNYLLDNRLSLPDFLLIALQVAETINTIHKHDIIHKDINPHNIIIKRREEEPFWTVKITDFNISSVLSREIYAADDPEKLEGTLAYMSPEQTGRMNRSIDYRTDLYSLGVTFYEMITGHLPFATDDPMEMVHCHIAKEPAPPHERNKQLPKVVSAIILKLMAKNPENRYKSAKGVVYDIQRCLKLYQETGKIEPFELALNDISDKFFIPEKLYGRDSEINILLNAFRNASKGHKQFLFISGYSGVGKTAIINEIYKPIIASGGNFITGKFEEINRETPFQAFLQAFQGLVKHLLTQKDEVIKAWKEKLLRALTPNAQLINDVIPKLELIIGRQPEVPELGPAEAQNRFNLYFERFMQVCASDEYPLVLFLDDLQWIDSASLFLLEIILESKDLKHFLLIGTYRENEISSNHPLIELLGRLREKDIAPETIRLKPLDIDEINLIIDDTLVIREEKQKQELANLIKEKTGGNPFFVKEFLTNLYKDKFIYYKNGWLCDFNKIRQSQITDNLLDLMLHRIEKLSPEVLELLKKASCLGVNFNIRILATVFGKSEEETFDYLRQAIDEGIIIKLENGMRFSHDRMLEAVYSLLSEEESKEIHYTIGMTLLSIMENNENTEDEDRFYEMMSHLNRAESLITSGEETALVARLNLDAAFKAMSATAYVAAYQYLKTAAKLLKPDSWQTEYNLTLTIYMKLGEIGYLRNEEEEAEKYLNVVLENAANLLDKIKVYEVKILVYTALYRMKEALELGKQALRMLGMSMPNKYSVFAMLKELLSAKLNMFNKKISDLVNLPELTDPHKLAIARVLMECTQSSYMGEPKYSPILVMKLLNLSLAHGNSIYSSFSYVAFGVVLAAFIGDIKRGFRFGRIGLNVHEKFKAKEIRSKVYFSFGNLINHWMNDCRENQGYLTEAYTNGLETGDFSFGSYAINNYMANSIFIGNNLEDIRMEYEKNYNFISKLQHLMTIQAYEMWYQLVLNLCHEDQNTLELKGKLFDEDEIIPIWEKADDYSALAYYVVAKVFLYTIFCEYEKAISIARRGEKYMEGIWGMIFSAKFYFYYALSLLSHYDSCTKRQKFKYFRKIKQIRKKIKKWAKYAPVNFEHMSVFIEAEINRVKGRQQNAIILYNKALNSTRKHNYVHDEAIFNELISRFYSSMGIDDLGTMFLQRAYYNYEIWGAYSKKYDLNRKYPYLFTTFNPRTMPSNTLTTLATSGTSTSNILDLSTVIKASQALSKEIFLDRLLAKLMKIAIENAGAQKGFLVLENDGTLAIEAEGNISDDEISALKSIPVDSSADIPAAIIHYVERTKENLILHNASKEGIFINDSYVIEKSPRSILCVPIINQSKLTGIIYLENNLIEGAFTAGRIELLNILSTQAAISIENARLLNIEKDKAVLENEISMAKKIQHGLLPKAIPDLNSVDIAFKYVPMLGIGGDFINIYYDENSNDLGFFICDVSGHGISAALTATMINMSLEFVWEKCAGKPLDVLLQLRTSMIAKMGGNFFTTCICFLDLDTGLLRFVTAGHPPVLIMRKKGGIEIIESKGRLVNDFFPPNAEEVTVQLFNGDKVFLYTDGITEATNVSGKMLAEGDEEKFKEWLDQNIDINQESSVLCETIYSEVIEYTKTEALDDDFTILLIEYKGV